MRRFVSTLRDGGRPWLRFKRDLRQGIRDTDGDTSVPRAKDESLLASLTKDFGIADEGPARRARRNALKRAPHHRHVDVTRHRRFERFVQLKKNWRLVRVYRVARSA